MRSQNATAERNWANQVMCPDCYAAPGDTCTRKDASGRRVEINYPAHLGRITKAREVRELPFEETR